MLTLAKTMHRKYTLTDMLNQCIFIAIDVDKYNPRNIYFLIVLNIKIIAVNASYVFFSVHYNILRLKYRIDSGNIYVATSNIHLNESASAPEKKCYSLI